MKLWGGRFKKETNQIVDEFNASITFDYQLAEFDLLGSLAHVKMLGHCGILTEEVVSLIISGLEQIRQQIQQGKIEFNIADEDIHMNVERKLFELIGETAKTLHTGRSRNDQVALDLHLYLRHHLIGILTKLHTLMRRLVHLAHHHLETIMPGYTHLQRAEPVRLAHHLLAYFNMFYRDAERLIDSFARVNRCPLGAGALAGSGVAIDRHYVARLLGFDGLYENSLDAVSNRDHIVELLANASLIMMHLSKLSEEIILWCSQEFSFLQLDDAFCTGSSMMPQKKNPDVAELVRGKTGRVYGSLIGLLTVLKALPLAYNKDLQEDKEGLFDTIKTLNQVLAVYPVMLSSMQFDVDKMQQAVKSDYSNATQLANYLVTLGLPFRDAHEMTGKIVLHCIEQNFFLNDLPLEAYQTFYPSISEAVYRFLNIEQVVESHSCVGGTAKAAVMEQLCNAEKKMDEVIFFLENISRHS